MILRKARPEDLERLNFISVKSKSYWGYPKKWIELWKEDLTIDETNLEKEYVVVGEIDDTIIGFCSIVDRPENYEILHLWLLPEYIGKGLGRELLNGTIHSLCNKQKPIIVESDPNAESFYKSQGFVTYGQTESLPRGRFLPLMKKELNSTKH